ncbi:MAG: 2-oxoacid:ferredoxin oxidoreductase subunit beta [Candidatus Kerfeldbacteria bacterium]|nr:2-oxoacid:ferredoxin oxidoreductase subunit beta [Candidatus Kerfeldbacteria bacterium]
MSTVKDFETKQFPTWCPGCGDFGIWTAIKNAFVAQGLEPHQIAAVFGIGCSGNMASFLNVYGWHALHGRTIPAAAAIKLTNHKLQVLAVGGDGDGYSIGLGHALHAMRRNVDLAYIVHDNQIYGLTKGQASPTSEKGMVTKSTPFGLVEIPADPIAMAILAGATYVARGFSGNVKQLTELIVGAMKHKGFALVDVMQPCVTFNHHNTFHWFYDRVYELDKEGHDSKDKQAAMLRAMEWPSQQLIDEARVDRIPTGLFYQEERSTYEDELPQIKDQALVEQSLEDIDITSLMEALS